MSVLVMLDLLVQNNLRRFKELSYVLPLRFPFSDLKHL